MDWVGIRDDTLRILVYVAVYALLLLLARLLKDMLTPYRLVTELAKNDNPAVGLTLCGYFLATAIVFAGALAGPGSARLVDDLVPVIGYSALGIVFLNLSRWSLNRFMFRRFCNITAIVRDRNTGMAAVRAGVYIATGLIAAASITGQGGGVSSAIVFFLLGQLTLLLFVWLYDLVTPYHLQPEVAAGNHAAAIGFAGNLVALGLVVARGIAGDFTGWIPGIASFAVTASIGLVLLLVVRAGMDRVILTGHALNREIAVDRNVAAGLLEAGVAISFAIVLFALL